MDKTGNADTKDLALKVHWWVTHTLQAIMLLFIGGSLLRGHWLDAVVSAAILVIIYLPRVVRRRFEVYIPPEFEVLALIFIFASLFLGEVRGYYLRFWWWDVALHTASGLLLGIFGFLLVYVLNEIEDIGMQLKPRFVALFAFFFAVGCGALWEIFEFAMDELFGTNMQKAMLDDPSGLTDTMWDLIVDTIGALAISLWGWWWMLRPESSFIERGIRRFVVANPRLFRRTLQASDHEGSSN